MLKRSHTRVHKHEPDWSTHSTHFHMHTCTTHSHTAHTAHTHTHTHTLHIPTHYTFTHTHCTHSYTLTLTLHTLTPPHTAHTHTHSHSHIHTHTPTLTYRDVVDFLCIKHNLFLNDDLDKYHVTATRSGSPVQVNLDLPSTNYTSCLVEIRSTNQEADASSEKEKICVS